MCCESVVIGDMSHPLSLKDLRNSLGITQAELAVKLDVGQAAISAIEVRTSIPQQATVNRWLAAFNAVLTDHGSQKRVSYDELWSAFCVGRLHPAPAPKPDLSAGLSALGDLPGVDHSTTAPTAQGA